jgi:hypothetical protein
MGSFFENVKRQRLAANVTRKHHDRDTFTYASGAGYIVNWASLQALMRCEPKLVAEPVYSEDKMLGVCLEQRGLVDKTVTDLSVVQRNIRRGEIRGRPSAYSSTEFPSAIRINSRINTVFNINNKNYARNTFLFHYISGPKLFMLHESIKGFAAQRECVRKGSGTDASSSELAVPSSTVVSAFVVVVSAFVVVVFCCRRRWIRR